MKVVGASLKHEIRAPERLPDGTTRFIDTIAVGRDGITMLSIDAGCLVVNGRKAIPLAHVLEMDVEAGKR